MSYPDLLIQLHRHCLTVILLTAQGSFTKEFPAHREGVAALSTWSKDVVRPGSHIQIQIPHERHRPAAAYLAAKLQPLECNTGVKYKLRNPEKLDTRKI